LECKTFKDAAAEIERLQRVAGRSHPRVAGLEDRFIDLAPDILTGVAPDDLARALVKALTPKPAPRVDLDHVAPIRASVRDALEELVRQLPKMQRTTFRDLTGHHRERLEVIVRFLAVLELYKRGLVDIDQAGNFGELSIQWVGPDEADAEDLSTADMYD
ncbi:MAG: segregation/condensation protein A, partial [Acidimicrobiia bacterium]|nr:segregation/condensation protein A [Acidimicrobiia bacterium]